MEIQLQFARAVDLACGRMIALGLEREAMVELAYELAVLFDNDAAKREPTIRHGKRLERVMLDVVKELGGRFPESSHHSPSSSGA